MKSKRVIDEGVTTTEMRETWAKRWDVQATHSQGARKGVVIR